MKRTLYGPLVVTSIVSAFSTIVLAGDTPKETVVTSIVRIADDRPTGTTVSRQGRVFATLPYTQYSDRNHRASVVEILPDGTTKPFPNEEWNPSGGEVDAEPQRVGDWFLCVQSAWVDDLDRLWVLDSGSPRRNGVVPEGAKLVAIDLTTNAVVRTIVFSREVVSGDAYINDLRVDAERDVAYVTDTGRAGLIVVDLSTGSARRVLSSGNTVHLFAQGPKIEGIEIDEGVRRTFSRSFDGVAVDPERDLVFLGTQPWLGKTLYRISDAVLRNTTLSKREIEAEVEIVGTPAYMDGIALAPGGDIYVTDMENARILKVSRANGSATVIAWDERMQWPDTVGVGPDSRSLFVPSPRFH